MDDKKNPWNKNHLWEKEIEALKSIVIKTPLIEAQKWGGIVYTHQGKNVLGIGGFKSYFGLWFFNGVFLKDEANVLVAASEETKALRQWRFTSLAEINEKLILRYIEEAIANEEKGLVHKPEKKAHVISDFFQSQIKSDTNLAAQFEKLTAFKKREYIEYIDSAKQEKTKLSRMEKIKPLILSGKGLNDKYR